MRMAKTWYIRVRRGDLDVEGTVTGRSPHDAFLRLVRRHRIWPKRAYPDLEHIEGHMYWAYAVRRVVNSWFVIGGRYMAWIEEVQG